MHVHILGICGTLMGSIALLARGLGHHVTGTDENVYPPMSTQLEAAGIELSEGYVAQNIPKDADMVIIGNANLPRGNAAVEHVLDRGMAYTSGAEWLGRYLLPGRWVIAVAGTHGKTTTSSMIAWILEYAGLSPGFLIGGVPGNFPESARLGETDFFVIEADEYDTSYFDRRSKFLHYRPRTAVLGNLEYDHADIFPDLDAIKQQFHLLIRTIPAGGQIIKRSGDENLDDVLERGCWTPVVEFGAQPPGAITAGEQSSDGSRFTVQIDGKGAGSVDWTMTGQHNVNNALAAIAAARHAGVSAEVACEALSGFRGVKRRMEKIFESASLTVYDDFAHHPTAIEETLKGLREKVGNAHITCVIEPRSHTMRGGYHQRRLASSTLSADEIFWFRPKGLEWDMNLIERGEFFDNVDDIIERIATQQLQPESAASPRHVVIMSNGGFDNIHTRLVQRLA